MPATTQSATNHFKRCKPLLGTYVEVSVLSEKNNNDTFSLTHRTVYFLDIQRIENLMSFHDLDSELSYINREAYKHSCSISKDMEEVLVAALHLSKVTNGIYDISIAPTLVRNGILPGQQC